MSLYGNIAASIVAQLSAQVTAFRKVLAIADQSQIDILVKARPGCGVMVTSGRLIGDDQPMQSDVIEATVEVLIVTASLSGTQGIDSDDGAYDLVEDVHGALAGFEPTSAAIPLAYVSDDLVEAAQGRVLWVVTFTVGLERSITAGHEEEEGP
jgi:hypothetical protein